MVADADGVVGGPWRQAADGRPAVGEVDDPLPGLQLVVADHELVADHVHRAAAQVVRRAGAGAGQRGRGAGDRGGLRGRELDAVDVRHDHEVGAALG